MKHSAVIITPAMKYFTIVIVRLDRTIQNLLKNLDSPIKSENDRHKSFISLLAEVIRYAVAGVMP